jgi:hypothetical protein
MYVYSLMGSKSDWMEIKASYRKVNIREMWVPVFLFQRVQATTQYVPIVVPPRQLQNIFVLMLSSSAIKWAKVVKSFYDNELNKIYVTPLNFPFSLRFLRTASTTGWDEDTLTSTAKIRISQCKRVLYLYTHSLRCITHAGRECVLYLVK